MLTARRTILLLAAAALVGGWLASGEIRAEADSIDLRSFRPRQAVRVEQAGHYRIAAGIVQPDRCEVAFARNERRYVGPVMIQITFYHGLLWETSTANISETVGRRAKRSSIWAQRVITIR